MWLIQVTQNCLFYRRGGVYFSSSSNYISWRMLWCASLTVADGVGPLVLEVACRRGMAFMYNCFILQEYILVNCSWGKWPCLHSSHNAVSSRRNCMRGSDTSWCPSRNSHMELPYSTGCDHKCCNALPGWSYMLHIGSSHNIVASIPNHTDALLCGTPSILWFFSGVGGHMLKGHGIYVTTYI